MNKAERVFVPSFQTIRIGIDLLNHIATGGDSHVHSGFGEDRHGRIRLGRARVRKAAALWFVDTHLQCALRARAQLFSDTIAHSAGCGDKLPDDPVSRVDSVEPRLDGTDNVVLRTGGEFLRPRSSCYSVDASGRDLNGVRFPARGGELEPKRLVLMDRHN